MRTILIAACILLTGCTASGTGALAASSPASQTAGPLAADEAEIHVMKQLDISASAREEEGVVCRREAPLGSRIPVTRCYPAKPVFMNQCGVSSLDGDRDGVPCQALCPASEYWRP